MTPLPTPQSCQSRDAFADALVAYINEELPVVHPKSAGHIPFDRTTPLFGEGGIDSLSIIHIVSFLEAAVGATLSLQEINMRNFRTVEVISDLFWQLKKP